VAAEACLVGADAGLRRTRRALAITRPELGLTLPGVLSALDVELALQLLRAMCDPAATGSREGCT
jgi:rsbT antagonist protein RsbS